MTETAEIFYGDPWNMPFWEGAERKQLVMQHCSDCDTYQFYGRPFCLSCDSTNLDWKPVSGKGQVYSMSRVHLSFDPNRKPPYIVALVDLDEGPRMLTNIIGDNVSIGDRVIVHWQERDDAPPLALFKLDGDTT